MLPSLDLFVSKASLFTFGSQLVPKCGKSVPVRDAVRLEIVHGERGVRLRPLRGHRRHGAQRLHISRVRKVAPHRDTAGAAVAAVAIAGATALRGALSSDLGEFDGVALGGPCQEGEEEEGRRAEQAQHGRRSRSRALQTISALAPAAKERAEE